MVSTNSTCISLATSETARATPLLITPITKSTLSRVTIRRNSFTASPGLSLSSRVTYSILRPPSSPPLALISSAAISWAYTVPSVTTAAIPDKLYSKPILIGGLSAARAGVVHTTRATTTTVSLLHRHPRIASASLRMAIASISLWGLVGSIA